MRFSDSFDTAKSLKTKADRGMDFIEARAIWNDPYTVDVPTSVEGEKRTATVGKVEGRLWVAIWTEREDGIRIISVRRAEGTKWEKAYNV